MGNGDSGARFRAKGLQLLLSRSWGIRPFFQDTAILVQAAIAAIGREGQFGVEFLLVVLAVAMTLGAKTIVLGGIVGLLTQMGKGAVTTQYTVVKGAAMVSGLLKEQMRSNFLRDGGAVAVKMPSDGFKRSLLIEYVWNGGSFGQR